ncbi:MAG: hypothetical protein ACI94Y_001286 [Maribacter sp.]|jgi:hypothetical protein
MLISKTIINASKEKIWEVLLDKIYHPDKYIPGIIEFEWTEREENEIVRTIYTETDDVVELIIIDSKKQEITSSLVRHTFLKGKLTQRIEETNDGVQLVFEHDRIITLDQLKGLDMQPALDAAMDQLKNVAETAA